jgi:hypothetical protein
LIQQFRHKENGNPVVDPVGAGSPAVKTIGRSQKHTFGQEGIPVPFYIKFHFPPKNIENFALPVAVGTKVNPGSFVAFVMPYFYMTGTKNTIIYDHRTIVIRDGIFFQCYLAA